MPKSSSERSSKSEFSDSEFVFGGGLNLMVVLTWEMGVERGMGIWEGDGNLGGGEGALGGGGEGDLGEMGIWLVETVMWRVVERGIWGWGSLPISPSKESAGREWTGNWYCRGTQTLWRGGSGGWGSLPISPSMESSGREWRGNWYYRGTRML